MKKIALVLALAFPVVSLVTAVPTTNKQDNEMLRDLLFSVIGGFSPFIDENTESERAMLAEACRDPPPVEVSCSDIIPERRYFYNKTSGRCEFVSWQGCVGTRNMFKTPLECIWSCLQPAKPYSTKLREDMSSSIVRNDRVVEEDILMSNVEINQHDASIPRSQQHNSEDSLMRPAILQQQEQASTQRSREPQQQQINSSLGDQRCSQAIDTGPCRAFIPSFGYDSSVGHCKLFIYGGCFGTSNRFASNESCSQACAHLHLAKERMALKERGPPIIRKDAMNPYEVCNSPTYPDTNGRQCPVAVAWPMYQFNADTRRCERFTYTGCKPVANMFSSMMDCQKTCDTVSTPYSSHAALPQQQQLSALVTHPPNPCPPELHPVMCLVNLCDVSSCHAYPHAHCRPNYCGGCNVNYYIGDQLVNCTVPVPQPVEPQLQSPISQQSSSSLNFLPRLLSQPHQPFVLTGQQMVGQMVIPSTFGNNNRFLPQQPQAPFEPKAPQLPLYDVERVEQGIFDPIRQPPQAQTYNGDNPLPLKYVTIILPSPTTETPWTEESLFTTTKSSRGGLWTQIALNRNDQATYYQQCNPGVPAFQCDRNLCTERTCAGFPEAVCYIDNCGGCFVRFYLGMTRVDCAESENDMPVIVAPEHERQPHRMLEYFMPALIPMPMRVFYRPRLQQQLLAAMAAAHPDSNDECPYGVNHVTCQEDPCQKAACQTYPTATCHVNTCGDCTAEFFIGNTKVDCSYAAAAKKKR